jgi:hypothetical protein
MKAHVVAARGEAELACALAAAGDGEGHDAIERPFLALRRIIAVAPQA